MERKDIRQIRAALAVVRESEALWLRFEVSYRSVPSGHDLIGDGLNDYLKTTKRTLRVRLVIAYMQMVFSRLSKTTLVTFRAWWLRITG